MKEFVVELTVKNIVKAEDYDDTLLSIGTVMMELDALDLDYDVDIYENKKE